MFWAVCSQVPLCQGFHSLIQPLSAEIREPVFFELPPTYHSPAQRLLERLDQMLRAERAFSNILDSSKGRRHQKAFMALNVLFRNIPIVQYARSGGALSETFGHRKVELRGHDIAKVVESESAFVRNDGLYPSITSPTPKRPSDEILV